MRTYNRQSKQRITHVLTLLMVCTSTFAQQYQLDSSRHRTFDEVGKEIESSLQIRNYDAVIRIYETVNRFYSGENFSSEKTQIRYDTDGKSITQSAYQWNIEQNDWIESLRWSGTYSDGVLSSSEEYVNEDGQLVGLLKSEESNNGNSTERIEYMHQNSKWLPKSKLSILRNTRGKDSINMESVWEAAEGSWIPNRKHVFEYRHDSLLTEHKTFVWKDEWKAQENISRKYNETGKMTDEVTTVWKDNIHTPLSKRSLHYDKVTFTTSDTSFLWDSTHQEWIPQELLQETLNEDGSVDSELVRHWDKRSSSWKDFSQIVYFNDAQKRDSQQQYFQFDSDGTASGTQYSWKYDEKGNRNLSVAYQLDPQTGNWTETDKTVLIFDHNIEIANLLYKERDTELDNEGNKHVVTEIKHYEVSEGKEHLTEERKYYYSKVKKALTENE